MTTAVSTAHGGLENLVIGDDLPALQPAAGEILVEVCAAVQVFVVAVNRPGPSCKRSG